VLTVLAGCSACDADYEIARPPSFATPLAPAPAPRIEFHPDEIVKNLPAGSGALPAKPAPCTLVTDEEVRLLLGATAEPGQSLGMVCMYELRGTDVLLTVELDTHGTSVWDARKSDVASKRGFAELTLDGGAAWRLRRGDQFGVFKYRGASSPSVFVTSTIPFRASDAQLTGLMKTIATRL
jgi:hypothetical protein